MSLEHEKRIEKSKQISMPLTGVVSKSFGEYFLNTEHGNELVNRSIPLLLEMMSQSFDENLEVTFGGSAMEILSGLMTEGEYWHLKKEIKDAHDVIAASGELSGERAKTVKAALERLSGGDPDFDFYLPYRDSLKTFFDRFADNCSQKNEIEIRETETGGQKFEIQISENIILETYWGLAYKGAKFDRVQLQLKDKDNKPLFHIDITALAESKMDAIQNRRQAIGDVHNKCRGKIITNNNKLHLEYDPILIPKANKATKMELVKNEKDPKTFFEVVLRELRKKTMHFDSINNPNRDHFEIAEMYPLMEAEDIFTLRELFFGDKKVGNDIYESQSVYQKEMIYQEFFLIVQKDPFLALVMLQDTGLDALFSGRHLTRRELYKIATSPYLNFANITEDDLNVKVSRSRKARLIINDNGRKCPCLVSFIKALGQVLGPEEDWNRDDLHLARGLKKLTEPKSVKEEIPSIKLESLSGKKREIMEQLLYGGGLTERALNSLIEGDIRKDLIDLKKANLIETANRIFKADNKIIKPRFYYPCVSSIKINTVLYQAQKSDSLKAKIIDNAYRKAGIESIEAAVGISPRELRQEGEDLLAFFHPIFLRYLINLQREVNKEPKTYKYMSKRHG